MRDLRSDVNDNGKPQSSSGAAASDNFALRAPAISLPKGGGAIRGIGEKFAANPVTGTGSMSIPIYTSPGRAGFDLKLALSYDSGAGNGPFGFGWSLSIPAITRKTDKGLPRYRDADDSDVFVLAGAEDLAPELGADGKIVENTRDGYQVRRYYPRIEGSFARIERWSRPGDIFWRSISRDNVTTVYGKTDESRIYDPAERARIFSWLVCETYDDKGNAVVYAYAREDAETVDRFRPHERNRESSRTTARYLKRIRYGNRTPRGSPAGPPPASWLFEVVFDYDEGHWESLSSTSVRASSSAEGTWRARPDVFSSYRSGFEVRSYRRCRRVLMFHQFPELGADQYLVRSTELDYHDLDYTTAPTIETELAHRGSTRFASFLRTVTQRGHVQDPKTLPVVRGAARYHTYVTRSLPPIELDYSRANIDDAVREVSRESLENLPIGLDGTQYQWVDLDGEGLSGVLTEQAGTWFYKRNVAVSGSGAATPRFGPLEQLRTMPAPADLAGGQQLLDLSGNGRLDVVQFGGAVPGYFERTPDAGWESFTPFASVPNVAFGDPNLRFVDLTGDGHADLLITDDGVFTWYPSLAEQGFGAAERVYQERDEERGPHLVFADGSKSIYLADMSGDGLTDLVRIRNGEVCYWPSLGYGRFGAKVTMDQSPWFDAPDRFDHRRVRLADIDGSGTIDILYLEPDGVSIYFNRSGNSFGAPRRLSGFPRIDNLSSVTAVDLLGNGTACLVWSSPLAGDGVRPMRYIDLMGGQKPHLLISVKNNLGAETRVEYAPSTRFYLADKLAGAPWITRLPFPVHCVERVTVTDDWRETSFSTSYSYHHGYFDGVERELRGFGRVEQVDVQSFGEFAADKELHQPPVKTVTWYHTGAFLDRAPDQAPKSFAAEVSSDHPIAFYRLNEATGATSTSDASGNGNHGALSSTGVTLGVPGLGVGDTAARFDGLGSGRIIVSDREQLNPKRITMEALVEWSGPNGFQQRILEKSFGLRGPWRTDYALSIMDDGAVRVEIATGAPIVGHYVTSKSKVKPNKPTHVAGTYDGNVIAIYIDGVLDTFEAASEDISSTLGSSDLGIGNQADRDRPFHGVIDEVAIYNRALPAERVRAHAMATGVSTGTKDTRIPQERILSQYEGEYFPPDVPNGFREHVLPEPVLAETLTPDERREALRACKGSVLRQEVYELDLDALDTRGEHRPVRLFTTAFHNCDIQCLQPRGTNLHAVFLVTESEAITYHYDLDLRAGGPAPDPRVAHTMNLAIDELGNVLQSVAVVYPRHGRHEDTGLPPGAEAMIASVQRDEQGILLQRSNRHLAYTENRFTTDVIDDDQDYRLPAPCEMMTYELTGITPAGLYFDIAELRKLVLSDKYPAHATPPGAPVPVGELAYHQLPTNGTIEKRLVEHVRILYFDAGLTRPRNLGELGPRGLPFETYKLALTEGLLSAVFDAKLTTAVRAELAKPDRSGYLSGELLERRFGAASAGQYWIRSGVAELDAARFYLPTAYVDAFDNRTELTYLHDLLVASRTDAMLSTVSVEAFDLRVLAPARMKDINDNVSVVVFDALGMPAAMAITAGGDDVTGLEVDPSLQRVSDFFTKAYAEGEARLLLRNATARHLYYFGERREADGSLSWGHHPASASTILRERHVADLPAGGRLQAAFEYSDGTGAVLVKKTKAEPAPNTTAVRWIAGGKTVLNNKGKPVKQYEPYFSSNEHRFEELVEVGVTPVLYYDAVGRLIRTELPDGSYSRVEFSPWHVASFDANDTVGEPGNAWYARHAAPAATVEQQRAASLAKVHADTPALTFLDSLGRAVIAVQHDRFQYPGDPAPSAGTKHVTFTKLDAEGKPLWIRDARGNLVMQYIRPAMADAERVDVTHGFAPCYDLAGNLLFQHSMDSGERWILNDAAGQPMFGWDANERAGQLESRFTETHYDALHRPTRLWLQTNTGPPELVERLDYGEGVAGDRARNLRGQLHEHRDPSGLSTVVACDFAGRPVEVTRRLAKQYELPRLDWQTATLESETFTQITTYDALGRMQRLYSWHRANDRVAVYEPTYNDRGLLESEALVVRATKKPGGHDEGPGSKRTSVIEAITYDAKGQREAIRYANRTQTRFTYDPETFRLVQLRTTRPDYAPPFPSGVTQFKNAEVVQNLHYTYDPVGNITEIYDNAYKPAFFSNQVIEPQARYTYDALYRLIATTGREHASAGKPDQREPAPLGASFPVKQGDPADQRMYLQRYRYDAVGNISKMEHTATSGWTRNYDYADHSNRLAHTWFGTATLDATPGATTYDHDTHGNMLNLASVAPADHLQWDHRDMIQVLERGGGGRVYYQYDAGKQRTRKVSVTQNGAKAWERIYLGGMEIYRRYDSTGVVEETESHHVFEGDHRVLLVEDVLKTDQTGATLGPLYRYQYVNHLGSSCLELDATAAVITYEEYHPYGTTAYRTARGQIEASKRYRFTGMERDEESGLGYHRARYYASWLSRWLSADPSGVSDSINVYGYARQSPMGFVDLDGHAAQASWLETAKQSAAVEAVIGLRSLVATFNITNPTARSTVQQDATAARTLLATGNYERALETSTGFQEFFDIRHEGVANKSTAGEQGVVIVGHATGFNQAVEAARGETRQGHELKGFDRFMKGVDAAMRLASTVTTIVGGVSRVSSGLQSGIARRAQAKVNAPYESIAAFRKRAGIPKFEATKPTGTVALAYVDGGKSPRVGVSPVLAPSQQAPKENLFRAMKAEGHWPNSPNRGHLDKLGGAQSTIHAEANALYRSYAAELASTGVAPKSATIFSDRITCSSCERGLGFIAQFLELESLTVYSGGRTTNPHVFRSIAK